MLDILATWSGAIGLSPGTESHRIVIGPTGIYVIEVKNPTKFKDDRVRCENGQVYVGRKCLAKKNPIAQVQSNSRWVQRILERSTNHKIVEVKPVLLFPNMMVDEYLQDVRVLNPKRFVGKFITERPKILSTEAIHALVSMVRMHIQTKSESPVE
jgi:hypothetical protein